MRSQRFPLCWHSRPKIPDYLETFRAVFVLQFNKRRYFSLIRIGIVSTAPTPQIEHNGFAAQVGKLELAATEQWQFEVRQQLACKILNQTVRAAVFLGSTLRPCVILRAAEPGDQEKRTRERAFDKIDHLAMFNDAAYWAADILVNYSRFPPALRWLLSLARRAR